LFVWIGGVKLRNLLDPVQRFILIAPIEARDLSRHPFSDRSQSRVWNIET
jgi:hypothetical protein